MGLFWTGGENAGTKKNTLPGGLVWDRTAQPSGSRRIPPFVVLENGIDLLGMYRTLGVRNLLVLHAFPPIGMDHIPPEEHPAGAPLVLPSTSQVVRHTRSHDLGGFIPMVLICHRSPRGAMKWSRLLDHSDLKASTGSTLVARRAGIKDAARPHTTMIRASKVAGRGSRIEYH